MTSSNAQDLPGTGSSGLEGVRVLLVEDSWQLGTAMKSFLRACGADVAGPVATAAQASRLMSEQVPDVALIDFNLRGGERADDLIDQLNNRGVRVIVTTGYADVPLAPGKAAAILQKPVSETQLLAALRPLTKSPP